VAGWAQTRVAGQSADVCFGSKADIAASPTNVRYSGASFGFQVSAALGGGFAPLIATALVSYTGGTAGVSIMLVLLALITLVATLFARETKDEALLQ
jgi:uncharacterized membrane protein